MAVDDLLVQEVKEHHDCLRTSASIFVAIFTFLATSNLLALRNVMDDLAADSQPLGKRVSILFFIFALTILNGLAIWAAEQMRKQFRTSRDRVLVLFKKLTSTGPQEPTAQALLPESAMPVDFALALARCGQYITGLFAVTWLIIACVMIVRA